MRRIRNLWRSMPLRLALLLVLLFTTISLLSLAASYGFTHATFEQTIRDDLNQDMAGFRAAPTARAVSLLVEAESRETDPGRLVLSYVAPGGRIFGNAAIARDAEGYHVVSIIDGQTRIEGDYLALTARLYGGQLTIARSRAELDALGSAFLGVLWISLLPTVLIALGGGLYLARRSKRHVETIAGTLDQLTGGDLAARVTPGPRWSDDLLQIGQKINRMAGAQERVVTSLREVSTDIAHDLKTPIQRVSLQLDELIGALDPASPAHDLASRAQSELRGIASVFQSLLQLAQVDAGEAEQHFAPVDLAKLAQTMVEVHESAASAQGQTLHFSANGPAVLRGEKNLLGQMLSNLIENAVRHAGQGAAITVALTAAPRAVTLSVTDTGPGIPAPERAKVLGRLYRLDRSRATPGHGLGLSLVDSIARLHGAALTLQDAAPGLHAELHFPVEG
ncbi:MAG: sensor histidine kinase [Sulfitobacter sp.]